MLLKSLKILEKECSSCTHGFLEFYKYNKELPKPHSIIKAPTLPIVSSLWEARDISPLRLLPSAQIAASRESNSKNLAS